MKGSKEVRIVKTVWLFKIGWPNKIVWLFTPVLMFLSCSSPPPPQRVVQHEVPYVTIDEAAEKIALNNSHVCLIGIDALTWDILGPMIDRNELPNFKNLISRGASGILDTADPVMYSPRIWTTVATGKSAEKHGIKFFLIDPHGAKQSGKTAGSDMRTCLAIWNILSHFQKRVLVSNWMVSWPAEVVLGTIISDYPELDMGAFPQRLQIDLKYNFFNSAKRSVHYERIRQRFFPWYLEDHSKTELSKGEQVKLNNLVSAIYKDEFTLQESLKIHQESPADLSMLYLRSVDIASHFYWKYSQLASDDPRLQGLEQEMERFQNLVPEIYRWADERLGQIVAAMPDNTTFIVLSDHGFRTYFNDLRGYNLTRILKDMNCAHFSKGELDFSVVADTADPIEPVRRLHIIDKLIDAYTETTGKTEDQLIQEIMDVALSIKTTNGAPLLTLESVETLEVIDGEEPPELVFRFNTTDVSPKDILVMDDKEVSIENYIQFMEQSGNHDPKAVIIVSGEQFQTGRQVENSQTMDIVPTILTLFDLPVADDMDGKPLVNTFEPEFLDQHPRTRIQTYEGLIERAVTEVSDPERPDIIMELKTLGYIQ